jgi:hypothetical protein
VRVGIATGLVVVGDFMSEGPGHENEVVGETPNLAARLQALAEPDAVVISSETRRLLGDLFECHELAPVRPKGFHTAVCAHQVLGEKACESRFKALHGAQAIAVCGGDAREAVKSLIVANHFLETDLERLRAAVSTGYARGKLFEAAKTLPRDRKEWYD